MNNKRHEHLVPLLASCVVEDKMQRDDLYLVMPLAEGGDMQNWLFAEQTPPYPPDLDRSDFRTNFIFVSIQTLVGALAYLHASTNRNWTAHYDIKPKNILLYHERGKWLWKIGDFGHGKLKLAGGDSGTERGVGLGTFEYQPPEYDGLKKVTLAFDVFSMGCVIIELATLVAVGNWNCKSVSTFYEMRCCNSAKQASTRKDASFRNNMNVVKQWVVDLRQKGASPMLGQILDVAQDMILRDPSGRPLACEVAIDIWSLMHPEKENAVFEEQCERLLHGQMPDTRFNDHNPTRREPVSWLSGSRERIRRECLIKAGWAASSKAKSLAVKQTNLSAMSTLPLIFDNLELYGREKLLKRIDDFFNVTRTVGLFGLGGIGKSHLAWQYAAQVREKDPRTHVFWIQALNMSTFENSYRKTAHTIGNINGVGEQMMVGVKEWLEDPKNSPWIMVIDGVEQHRPKAKTGIGNFDLSETSWEHICPWNAGQILITAKARELVAHYCVDPSCTIQVGDLHPDSGGSLLRRFANPSDPRDYEFAEPLAKMLHLPILIKITGKYINIYQQHGWTIQNVFKRIHKSGDISRLTTEQLDMHQVGFGSVNPGLQDIFTILFDIFESEKTDLTKYHQIFTIICCFSNENVTKELVRDELKTLDAINGTFYTLTNFCYLTPKSLGMSREHAIAEFEVHELIQIMWLNRISRHENGRYRVWTKRMRVLDIIFENYRKDRSKLNADEYSIHNLKLRYKIHFEQFLRALKAEKYLEFQFRPYAARCVIGFARMFRDEARFDDAELLLTRLIDQGIKAASGRQGTQERLEAMRALAETYRSRASGRTEFTTLKCALAVLDSAVEEALALNEQEFAWKMQADRIRLYYQKGKKLFTHDQDATPTLEKAQAALSELIRNRPDNPPKKSEYMLRVYECQALVYRLEALLKKDLQLLYSSLFVRSLYCECLESSTYDVFDIKERAIEGRRHYADTCLDILDIQPSASARDSDRLTTTAWSEYGKLLYERESEYGSESKFAYDAKLDQASAQLKISLQKGDTAEVKDCTTTFEQVLYFYSDRLKLPVKDKHVRKCAYDLREAHMYLKNSSSSGSQHDSEIKKIEQKYNLKAHGILCQ